jgi:hypothetical protein
MFSEHISRPLLKILAISAAAFTLACSPSQQDEHQSPAGTESPPSAMHAADSAPFAIHTPEMWEVKIARMVAEGNIEGAGVELHKLREEFPEYAINPSLLEKLNRNYE